MKDPVAVHINPIERVECPDEMVTNGGFVIADPAALAEANGASDAHALLRRIELVQAGVQKAAKGAIQDPAGSAIGAAALGGGGASGAIYATFKDLEPIPAIKEQSAIFNRSKGPGRRVLHTHSPRLAGSPTSASDRQRTLEALANSYANALVAFDERRDQLGDDGAVLNLVPVSAAIFAGPFRDKALDHLHPSYTIAALLLAMDRYGTTERRDVDIALYVYDPAVHEVAAEVLGSDQT